MATTQGGAARTVPAVVVDVTGYRRPDLALVDVLSRLRLVTARLGVALEVRGAGSDLARLLEYVGLLAVIPVDAHGSSEVGGETEALETDGCRGSDGCARSARRGSRALGSTTARAAPRRRWDGTGRRRVTR